MTPRYYTPEVMHLTFNGDDRLCGTKIPITTWSEHSMRDKVSSKLPICELCKIEYESKFDTQYIKGKSYTSKLVRRAKPTNVIRTLNWYHNQCHTKMTNGIGSLE